MEGKLAGSPLEGKVFVYDDGFGDDFDDDSGDGKPFARHGVEGAEVIVSAFFIPCQILFACLSDLIVPFLFLP